MNATSHPLPPHSNTPPCLSIPLISLSSAPTTPEGAAIGHVAKTRPTHAASSPPLSGSIVILLTLAPACLPATVIVFRRFTCASSWAYQTFLLLLSLGRRPTHTHIEIELGCPWAMALCSSRPRARPLLLLFPHSLVLHCPSCPSLSVRLACHPSHP